MERTLSNCIMGSTSRRWFMKPSDSSMERQRDKNLSATEELTWKNNKSSNSKRILGIIFQLWDSCPQVLMKILPSNSSEISWLKLKLIIRLTDFQMPIMDMPVWIVRKKVRILLSKKCCLMLCALFRFWMLNRRRLMVLNINVWS